MITFASFFQILEYELQQEAETGDPESADGFKILREDIAKEYVNETLDELVDVNPYIFASVQKHHFNGTTYYWKLPDYYAYLLAYKNSNGQWQRVDDNSNTGASITVYDKQTIRNKSSWKRGDTIEVKVARYPSPVIEDNDPVDIERRWLRYLRLKIIEKARGNVGKAMSQEMTKELAEKEQRFLEAGDKIHKRSFMAFRGFNFGNGR